MLFTLQQKTLQVTRESLLEASPHTLKKYFDSAIDIPDGAMYLECSIKSLIRWDAVAYAIVNFALTLNGYIFGGFITAHFSGLVTNDIDVYFTLVSVSEVFRNALPQVVASFLDIDVTKVRMDVIKIKPDYAASTKYQISIDHLSVQVKIDICIDFDYLVRMNPQRPVTWGRFLILNKKDGFRYQAQKSDVIYSVMQIIRLLKNGEDIWYLPSSVSSMTSSTRTQYKKYFLEAATKVIKSGYTMNKYDDLLARA
jgi:hypothetical protein